MFGHYVLSPPAFLTNIVIFRFCNFRCIEQLRLSLKDKDALIQHLEEAKSQSGFSEENLLAEKTQALMDEKERNLEVRKVSEEQKRFAFVQYEILWPPEAKQISSSDLMAVCIKDRPWLTSRTHGECPAFIPWHLQLKTLLAKIRFCPKPWRASARVDTVKSDGLVI